MVESTGGALPTHNDGILDPQPSEVVTMPADLAAYDSWAAAPDDDELWKRAKKELAPAEGAGDSLAHARDNLALAVEPTKREKARQELASLLDDQRPLSTAARFRPASDISDPTPRTVLRAAGQGGAVLSEGTVCLLSGAGRGRQVHALLDPGSGRGIRGRSGRARQPRRAGEGVFGSVPRSTRTRDDRKLRGPRVRRGVEAAVAGGDPKWTGGRRTTRWYGRPSTRPRRPLRRDAALRPPHPVQREA